MRQFNRTEREMKETEKDADGEPSSISGGERVWRKSRMRERCHEDGQSGSRADEKNRDR